MTPAAEQPELDPSRTRIFTVMTHGARTIRPDLSLEALLHLFVEEKLSRVLVVSQEGKPLGVVSKSNVVVMQLLQAEGGETPGKERIPAGFHVIAGWTVGDIMTREVVSVAPDATILDACRLMLRNATHGFPVIEPNGKVIGWFSAMDVVQWVVRSAGGGPAVPQ